MRLIAILVAAALVLALPFVLSGYERSLLVQILVFGLFAMSIDLLAGFAGRVSLGHAAIFGVGAYITAYYVATYGGSPWAGAALGVVGATIAACAFGALAVRTSGVYFLLLTLAEGMLVWGVCYRWNSVTGAENGIRGVARPELLADPIAFYYAVLAVTACAAWLMWRLTRSPFGLTLRGIMQSESRMRTLGYNVPLHLLLGFTASGFFAGIAGVLYAFYNSFVSPVTVSLEQSTIGLLMMILGGVGTLFGSLIGSALIILLQNLVSIYTERWQTVLGLLFIVTVIVAPQGVVGTLWAWLGSGPPGTIRATGIRKFSRRRKHEPT